MLPIPPILGEPETTNDLTMTSWPLEYTNVKVDSLIPYFSGQPDDLARTSWESKGPDPPMPRLPPQK